MVVVCWWHLARAGLAFLADSGPALSNKVRQATSRLGEGCAFGQRSRRPCPIISHAKDAGNEDRRHGEIAVVLVLVHKELEGLRTNWID